MAAPKAIHEHNFLILTIPGLFKFISSIMIAFYKASFSILADAHTMFDKLLEKDPDLLEFPNFWIFA
ncbi:conserved hypothetical protein [Ricinus communis]|uniref:Uncharacterized protein n=1 Tax=Ricinus communis TaxID=3988 RepID=B9SEH7_RICCO|nr:conserved hypothetical protein [Ricinus communis]